MSRELVHANRLLQDVRGTELQGVRVARLVGGKVRQAALRQLQGGPKTSLTALIVEGMLPTLSKAMIVGHSLGVRRSHLLVAQFAPKRVALAFDESQPRNPDGTWGSGGGLKNGDSTSHVYKKNGNEFKIEYVRRDDEILVHVDPLEGSKVWAAGSAKFAKNSDGTWSAREVNVHKDFQRQGIASKIYSQLEAIGHKIISSDEANARGVGDFAGQTDAGVAFFRSRKLSRSLKLAVFDDVLKAIKAKRELDLDVLAAEYEPRAFQVLMGLGKDIDQKVQDAIDELISSGASTREATRTLGDVLERAGISGTSPSKVETLFRTQLQVAFGAGRWQADQDPDIQEILWGYKYVTVGDDRVRPEHEAFEGVTLPKDDPFWQTAWPPNGWNCRCQAIPIFEEREIKKPSLVDGLPAEPDEGFGFNAGELLEDAELELAFDESLHPRDERGRFGESGGDSKNKAITWGSGGEGSGEGGEKKKAKIVEDKNQTSEATNLAKKATGVTEDTAHAMIGVPEDAEVFLAYDGENSVIVSAKGVDSKAGTYHMQRTFINGKVKRVENSQFFCEKPGSGFGARVLHTQVNECAKQGYSKITTFAAGSPGSRFNGYYTWARLGYDQELSGISGLNDNVLSISRGRVSDLMHGPGGRSAWKQFGRQFEGEFDLTEGSTSRQVLDAYVKEKREQGVKLAQERRITPKDKVEQPPELSEEDDRLLDEIWTRLKR